MKMLNKSVFSTLVCVFMLSACVSKESLISPAGNEASSIVKISITMDGMKDEGAFRNQCFPYFKDKNGKYLKRLKDNDTKYVVLKSEVGKVYLSEVMCSAYKVLFNKVRRYKFDNLYFEAKEGVVNYAGDIKIEWSSDRLKAGDFFLGGLGGVTTDDGTIQLGLQDDMDGAKAFMAREYGLENKPFKKSLIKNHDLLVR